MSYGNGRGAVNHYRNVGVQGSINGASPHRLIQMLLDGGLEKIAFAKGFMERGDIPEKGRHIGWAISIIDGLRASLDLEAGGELSANLAALYEYMNRRLVEANLRNDTAILDEVASLLGEIKAGWDALPEEVRRAAPPEGAGVAG